MNYTCACVGGFLVIEVAWWLIAGKEYSRSMQKATEYQNWDAEVATMIGNGGK